jgi:hypothetical protein
MLGMITPILVGIAEGIIAYYEGNFWESQNPHKMTFWKNWAAVYGLFFFSAINTVILPDVFISKTASHIIGAGLFGVIITDAIFFSWQRKEENNGHIVGWKPILMVSPCGYGIEEQLIWKRTCAGKLHFAYQSFQTATLLLVFFTPLPQEQIFLIGLFIALFLMIQNAQAIFIQKTSANKAVITMVVELTSLVILLQWVQPWMSAPFRH